MSGERVELVTGYGLRMILSTRSREKYQYLRSPTALVEQLGSCMRFDARDVIPSFWRMDMPPPFIAQLDIKAAGPRPRIS